MVNPEDSVARRIGIEAGREACRSGTGIDDCPLTDMFERDLWCIGWRYENAERESQKRRADYEAGLQDFGMALKMFRIGAAAARASWPEAIWLRLQHNVIVKIWTDGSDEPWEPTHADLLATDWKASSGVVGWTGLDLDINGNPWKKPQEQS